MCMFPALFSGGTLMVRNITSDVESTAPAFGLQAHLPVVVPAAIEPGNPDHMELCFGVKNFIVREIFP